MNNATHNTESSSQAQDNVVSRAAPEKHRTAFLQLQQFVRDIKNAADSASRLQAVQQTCELLACFSILSTDQLVSSGVLPVLVDCLTVNDDPQLQLEAATALTSVAASTSEKTDAVADAGAVPHFVQLLHLPLTLQNARVYEEAVMAIDNFICMSELYIIWKYLVFVCNS